MKDIQLLFRGSSNVKWSVPIVINTGHGSSSSYNQIYKSKHNFFNIESKIISKNDPKYHCYFYPFQFKLPYYISPSFNHSHGNVSYQCIAKIEGSLKLKNKIKCPFIIRDNYESNIQYKDINESKSSNNIHIDIRHPNICFIGENHQIIVSIKNESKKPIINSSVKLKSIMIFYGKHLFHSTKTETRKLVSFKLKDHSNFPILPGKFIKKNIAIHIPKNSPITIFNQSCPNIQVINHIIVKTVSKGKLFFKRKSKFSFPIIIGNRCDNHPDISSSHQDSVIHTSEINNPHQYFAPIYQIKGYKNAFIGKSVPDDDFNANKIIPEQFEGKIKEVNYDKAKSIIDKTYRRKNKKYY